MDTRTGELYSTPDEAIKAGVRPEDLVRIEGSEEAVRRTQAAVKDMARRLMPKRKRAKW